jgi:glycine oxidase
MPVGQALWPDQLDATERAALAPGIPDRLDREPDCLIVGGGMIGCATAAACVRAGLGSVVVLEREALGAGASGGAAGLLMPEAHVGVDLDGFVHLMRLGLEGWRDLDATWPGGVGLLPIDRHGVPQGRVNPLRAIARLSAALPCVATGVDVLGLTTQNGQVQSLQTSAGAFRPRQVVFATGLPPHLDGLSVGVPASEVKGHMLASASTSLGPPAALIDSARPIDDGRILLGGTLDTGDTERVVRSEVIARMWQELAAVWPPAADIAVEYRWACFRPAHPDHLPVIDRLPGLSNAWLTTGHYKTGIVVAPATGRALAAWMASGSPPPEVAPFKLDRLT